MEFRSRRIVKNEDLNGFGTLFGGKALAWIDEEAAIFCQCQLQVKGLVTKFMSEIDFKHSAHLGDIVEIGADLISVGRTSITIKCSIRNKTTLQEIITVDKIVFVHIDENGKAIPHNKNL